MAILIENNGVLPFYEDTLQFAVYEFTLRKQHPVCIPNIMTSYRLREADVLSLTRAGFSHEFEIKRTISDFRMDFISKKSKHYDLSMRYIGKYNEKQPAISNYYWFVAPEDIIPIKEIPEYAGLMIIKNIKVVSRIYNNPIRNNFTQISTWLSVSINIMKNAPLLHRSKFNIGNDFTRKLSTKYWNLNEKYLIQKYGDNNG